MLRQRQQCLAYIMAHRPQRRQPTSYALALLRDTPQAIDRAIKASITHGVPWAASFLFCCLIGGLAGAAFALAY